LLIALTHAINKHIILIAINTLTH